jgi:PAS domain S-box-containing protein
VTSTERTADQNVERPQRFIWASDAGHHLVLAAHPAAHPLRPWDGHALTGDSLITESSGAMAKALQDLTSFSHVPVHMTAAEHELICALSGAPIRDAEGSFAGFRGFGLVKSVIRAPAPPAPEPLGETSAQTALLQGGRLSEREQLAFAEIGRLLAQSITAQTISASDEQTDQEPITALPAQAANAQPTPSGFGISQEVQDLLDRLPVGVLVSRGDVPIVMNRLLLQSLGYDSADSFHDEGAITRLFPERNDDSPRSEWLALTTRTHETVMMRVMFQTIEWGQLAASMMVFVPPNLARDADAPAKDAEMPVAIAPAPEAAPIDPESTQRITELEAILDTATDGVVVIDTDGQIISLNKSAQALFGYEPEQMAGRAFAGLFAPESRDNVQDYFEGFRDNGVRSLMNDGREVIGQVQQGGHMPLFMTLGRTGDHNARFCAVLRDLTAWKKVESDLNASRKQAEIANAQKSDMLARISHELRTPLSAILGYAEVMVEERFGPIGNARYQDYLRDIHTSGHHLLSLVNDLLDLAKIEAGKFDLDFTAVDANATIKAALGMIYPEAERQRVFLRSSLTTGLPKIVADERTLRQVVLNVLSNAVKFTEAGGQVIVTSGLSQDGEVVLRIRDTGVGMDSEDIKTALELFRQTAAGRKAGGTGLGLPLTKALTEANRAQFAITSDRGRGTLIEITFPSNRVLAE